MHILVMGSGGVGGYFGAQYAKAGHQVTFVARGAHLAALKSRGLTIESALGAAHLAKVVATDDLSNVQDVDIVMFCVKLWDVQAAARQIQPLVRRQTRVIPFQNGVESHGLLQSVLGSDAVAGGVAHITAAIKAPGVVTHSGGFARLRVGTLDGSSDPQLKTFVNVGLAAGIDIALADDIHRVLWEKFVFLTAFSGLTATTRCPIGTLRQDPDLRALLEAAMRETLAIANAYGASIDAAYVDRQMQFIDGMAPHAQSSLMTDLLAGHRLEAPWLSGAVAQMARSKGLAAPIHSTLYGVLKPYINGPAHA